MFFVLCNCKRSERCQWVIQHGFSYYVMTEMSTAVKTFFTFVFLNCSHRDKNQDLLCGRNPQSKKVWMFWILESKSTGSSISWRSKDRLCLGKEIKFRRGEIGTQPWMYCILKACFYALLQSKISFSPQPT